MSIHGLNIFISKSFNDSQDTESKNYFLKSKIKKKKKKKEEDIAFYLQRVKNVRIKNFKDSPNTTRRTKNLRDPLPSKHRRQSV